MTDQSAGLPGVTFPVAGFCPMGCGQTLYLDSDGRVLCRNPACPHPTAVAQILDYRETWHIVDFHEADFTLMHPLRERLDNALMTCDLHQHIAGLDEPPAPPGRYRAIPSGTGWAWEQVTA